MVPRKKQGTKDEREKTVTGIGTGVGVAARTGAGKRTRDGTGTGTGAGMGMGTRMERRVDGRQSPRQEVGRKTRKGIDTNK